MLHDTIVTVGFILIGIAWLTALVIWPAKKESTARNEARMTSGTPRWVGILSSAVIGMLVVWNFSLQRRVHNLDVEMFRYVSPRQLTKTQIQDFGSYLSAHSVPHDVTVQALMGDEEAHSYASDFVRAFAAANWRPKNEVVNPTTIRCEPSSKSPTPVTCIADVPSAEGINFAVQSDPNEKLSQILQDAIKFAGIEMGGMQTGGPSETSVTVFVGHRRRDRLGILPPGYLETLRQHRPTLDNLTDDDY